MKWSGNVYKKKVEIEKIEGCEAEYYKKVDDYVNVKNLETGIKWLKIEAEREGGRRKKVLRKRGDEQ